MKALYSVCYTYLSTPYGKYSWSNECPVEASNTYDALVQTFGEHRARTMVKIDHPDKTEYVDSRKDLDIMVREI